MAGTAAALGHVRDQVDHVLNEFIGRQRVLAGEIAAEMLPAIDTLAGALAGGKRLRPAFCYWGWRGAGGDDGPEILTAAAALELLHAGALVHDDVLDGSDTRRGRPTVHRLFAAGWHGSADAFGRGVAILLGDLLLTWTDELFQASGLPAAALARGRPVLDVMRTEVMAGQYLDLLEQAAATKGEGTKEEGTAGGGAAGGGAAGGGAAGGGVAGGGAAGGGAAGALRVVRYKTAKYTIERPLHLGAALAGPAAPDPGVVRGYSGYGLPLGVAFQLRDDVLGVFGDPAETGKPAGDDIREGKRTVLVAIARQKATAAQAAALDRLLGDPAIGEDGIAEFRDLLTATGAVAECEMMIDRYVTEALAALTALPATAEAKAALAELAVAATARRD